MTSVRLTGVGVSLLGSAVVSDVDLVAHAGSWTALIGPNGAGKTTLLRTIASSVPHVGEITLDGAALPASARVRARTVAMVPQHPQRPPGMRVLDYVLLGRSAYIPYLGMERAEDLAIAGAQLERLELIRLADRPITTLSGGEFQRAVLARALAQRAPVLLLDEPTSSLDLGHAQQVLELVDELRRERDLTVISALHDLTMAGQYSDELVMLVAGRVVARGAAADVLTTDLIESHYGALVSVVHDEIVGAVLVPRRPVAPAPSGIRS